MRYMFLIYLDERVHDARPKSEIKAAMAAHTPYIELLRRHGQYASSDALAPARSAQTLRFADGRPVTTAGPFAESREQFGGYYVIEARDLDEALAAAARCPALQTRGVVGIEIRPLPQVFPATAQTATTPEPAAGGRYLFALYREEGTPESQDEEESAVLTEWAPHIARLQAQGLLAAAAPLAPAGSATTLRLRAGKVELGDGPFTAGPAQLGAYCVVWARDLDAAVQLARESPCTGLHALEVRAVRTPLQTAPAPAA